MISRTRMTLAATAASLALPATAGAHVTVFPEEAPAKGYAKVDFRVPHGCEGSPTERITVRLPDAVVGATPQVVPGWRISTREGRLTRPVEAHGERTTKAVREVSWSGGPLPDAHLQEFGMSIQTNGRPGEKAHFRILQECAEGETAWAEIPVEGEEEPESPAATLTLAEEGGPADVEAAGAAVQTSGASSSDVDGKASEGLAIAALVLGGLGLAAGAAGFAAARRARGTAAA